MMRVDPTGDSRARTDVGRAQRRAERVENGITLRYAEDYAAGSGFVRVVQATESNTLACRQSVAALAETRPAELEGGWLRADAAAAVALDQHVARYARPRRVASFNLPFGYAIEHGGLLEYGEAVWRITQLSSDAGWLQVTAEEVLS